MILILDIVYDGANLESCWDNWLISILQVGNGFYDDPSFCNKTFKTHLLAVPLTQYWKSQINCRNKKYVMNNFNFYFKYVNISTNPGKHKTFLDCAQCTPPVNCLLHMHNFRLKYPFTERGSLSMPLSQKPKAEEEGRLSVKGRRCCWCPLPYSHRRRRVKLWLFTHLFTWCLVALDCQLGKESLGEQIKYNKITFP